MDELIFRVPNNKQEFFIGTLGCMDLQGVLAARADKISELTIQISMIDSDGKRVIADLSGTNPQLSKVLFLYIECGDNEIESLESCAIRSPRITVADVSVNLKGNENTFQSLEEAIAFLKSADIKTGWFRKISVIVRHGLGSIPHKRLELRGDRASVLSDLNRVRCQLYFL